MAIDFPSTPTVGQQYTFAGVTYTFTAQGVWSSTLPAASGGPAVGFRAFKNGVNQTGMGNITWTKVTFPTEEYDNGSYYDTTLSRWTPPAGLIHIDARWAVSSGIATDSNMMIAVYKNGVEYKRNGVMSSSSAPTMGPSISIDDVASGTDFYEVYAFSQGIASTATIDGPAYNTAFGGHVVAVQGPIGPPGPSTGPGGDFPGGTVQLFVQTSAPTGWTKQTSHNDKALRVVSGTVSSGGTSTFSTVFAKTATDGFAMTTTYLAPHIHSLQDGAGLLVAAGANYGTPANTPGGALRTNSVGSGAAHAHPMDLRVQYVDVIIASKN